jgi:hypothetical protein
MPSLRRQMTPDRCSTIQARCRRASRRQPQRGRRCRRPGARRAEPACPPDRSECRVTRDGAPIDRPGGDAVAMVHLLERYPRLSERPFDRLCMRHCRVRVGIERCTDCAPACTAASASAPICAGCAERPGACGPRSGLFAGTALTIEVASFVSPSCRCRRPAASLMLS